ncbi:hypothetical protein [Nocardia sp. CC227C]|uniref:hypothetical protein n=1 Tax=Nocardia sp. CC227C TaxID=3044562 RepID=UPI00278C852C|nr:hypothetical protein [Nocardia sp. CC227C]
MNPKAVAGRLVGGVNGAVVALLRMPVVGSVLGRGFTEITYVGRRSGKTFSTPVNYWRSGDVLKIGVAMPDRKSWWRNFQDEGGPITMRLAGEDRTGRAKARRDERGRVTVEVRLD